MAGQRGWVERDARVFVRQEGSSPCLDSLARASGIWIEGHDGRRLIDLHGNTTHHIGHAHPRLIAAIKQQLDELTFSPRRFTNEPATLLAETLTRRFRSGRSRLLLAPSGSDAIEIAIRMARIATGRSGIVALEGSYHGHGFASLALSSSRLDPRLGSQPPDIHHVTAYWNEIAGGADRMLAEIKSVLSTAPGGIGCIVAEPMRSNCVVPPPDLWREVADMARRAGAQLIFDEIPSGLGKTGRFFAHEHFGATPDLVVLGKALGGGILPIAAVLAAAELDVAPELSVGHFTHEKNPVTARAALTTLQILDEEGLIERAARLGQYAQSRLAIAFAGDAAEGSIRLRGLGLLRAITNETVAAQPDAEQISDRLVSAALEAGVSTTSKGPAAIGFSPPLIINESEIDLAIERIRAAFVRVGMRSPARRDQAAVPVSRSV
jgi:4-aminobutyrate aminotransferase